MKSWNKMVPELITRNYEKSKVFYLEVIGFGLCFERSNPRFCYLDLDGAQIMLEEFHEQAWVTDELVAPFGRGLNLQIEVEDVAAIYQRTIAAGYDPFRALEENWYEVATGREGQREFLVQDPDGYLLRFSQPIE